MSYDEKKPTPPTRKQAGAKPVKRAPLPKVKARVIHHTRNDDVLTIHIGSGTDQTLRDGTPGVVTTGPAAGRTFTTYDTTNRLCAGNLPGMDFNHIKPKMEDGVTDQKFVSPWVELDPESAPDHSRMT